MPKRNANGSGMIRKREDGRWEARYTVGRDPGTGKQVRKTIYGKSQEEVRKKLTQVTAAIDDGVYVEPSRMTVKAWLDIWLAEYMGDKKYLTVKGYKAQCKTHIKPALGAIKLSALKPHDIQKFYNALGNRSDGKKPLASKSIRNVHGIFHKALAQAVSLGYLKQNPADVVTLPKVTKKEIQPLTDAQVSNFIKAVEKDDYSTLFKVIIFTGLRESEALGLTWDNIDYEIGSITVNKQLQKRPLADGGFVFAPLKNNKTRLLTPAPYVMALLKTHESTQKVARLKAGSAWQGWQSEKDRQTALVFTNELGRHLIHNTVYAHFKKIAREIEVPNTCVHDLRHTYAVISLQSGDDPKTVQENLGHHTAAFTLDVYGHVSEKMKQDSANRMERYIKNLQVVKQVVNRRFQA
ncbi:MAG: site-specific integrase [Oscillospiraceae bacterium]|nr:site-specific integrase [Oscillospiraceae bacterium]